MGNLFDKLATQNGTNSQSEGVRCEYCDTLIPPLKVEVMGKERWVQPVCKCESIKIKEELKRYENHQREREVERLFSISDIGDRYKDITFDNFLHREGSEKAFKIAKYYAEHFDEFGLESIMLWGVPGNGKTHLAAATHNYLKTLGKIVVFVSMPELLERIRSTFDKNNPESEVQILKALSICDLLIIDDIGAEKPSPWVEDIVYRIIDGRYRRKRPIMATSNLEPKRLAGVIGTRSYDRMVEMSQPIENTATSYRREVAKGRMSKFDELLRE